jgi:hypothetical protein
MSIEPGGFGTILSAPGRPLIPSSALPRMGEPSLTGEPAVAAQVEGLVRLLARLSPVAPSDELIVGMPEEPPQYFARIILRNGCLRLDEPGEPHAVLPPGTSLYVDTEGFLSVGVANGAETNPRVGELAWWPGGTRIELDANAVAQLRVKCGPGAVQLVGLAQSVSASQAAADGAAARNLVGRYGLPWKTALEKARTCRVRLAQNSQIDPRQMIENACGNTPPSPVADPQTCPAGTSLTGGLCRTPAGHIRPIPQL